VAALRLLGVLPGAYPSGPPAGVAERAHRTGDPRPAEVIVIADTDFLVDALWVRPAGGVGQGELEPWANNGDFVLNALDNLTGSADLIGIRGRASFARPFTRVEHLRTAADERLRGKAAELEQKLADTERRLSDLELRRDDHGTLALSSQQQAELLRFQQEKLRIRKELRAVHRGLDVEINRLGLWLKLLNVIAVPALLSVGALIVTALERRRRRVRRTAIE